MNDKTRQDNVLFGVLYSLMYIDLNIYFMTILTLFFIRQKKLQQKYTEISNALHRELRQRLRPRGVGGFERLDEAPLQVIDG